MNKKLALIASASILLSFLIYVYLFIYKQESAKDINNFRTSYDFELSDVKQQLSKFLKKFDANKEPIYELSCQTAEECNVVSKLSQRSPGAYGPGTWKIEFYSSLYQATTESEEKSYSLSRALELTDEYLKYSSNVYSTQAFVFLNAFKRTGRIEFLRAFIISTQSILKDTIEGSVYSQDWINQDHPMNLIRYPVQILEMSKLLSDSSDELINKIDFYNPAYDLKAEHISRFDWAKQNKELIESKSPGAAELYLELSKKAALQKPYFQPLSSNSNYTNAACWISLGYVSLWEVTQNPEFKYQAYSLLEDTGLNTGNFTEKNMNILQSLIPCLQSYKTLSKTDNDMKVIYKSALIKIIERFWDSNKAHLCSESGGFVLYSPESVKFNDSIDSDLCSRHKYSLADNSWMFSLINETENFKIQPDL